MERGNTKHGPAHDEQMAHETHGMVRGGAQRLHAGEWRETEPLERSVPPIRRETGGGQRPNGQDIELRSEFARQMTRDVFPADRAALLARLADTDAPDGLSERVATLPGRQRYGSPHAVLEALGLNSPERPGRRP